MVTIEIQDEQLARQLQQIAESENRPVEAVLRSLIAGYRVQAEPPISEAEKAVRVRQVRRKAYDKARRYWKSVGDEAKATLTDDVLDEQFGAFDEDGIPRLKAEMTTLEPPPGSLAYAAMLARKYPVHTSEHDLASRADEILNEEFGNYLFKRIRGEDAVQ